MNNQVFICNPFGKNAETAKICHESIAKILGISEILIPLFSFWNTLRPH